MKKIKAAIIGIMFVLINAMVFRADTIAAEKTVKVSIGKDYEACSFTITTEKEGNFTVTLVGNGGKYIGTIENGTSCDINVEDVKAGEWTINVLEILEDEETSEIPEDAEPEKTIVHTAEEYIGTVQVSAKAIDKTAFSIGNVTVARDIVGLKYYFKDDSIVVEWTDTSCGNVDITIIDANSSQILDRKTVQGMYYEYELPELTEEITINVVPTTSANIVGANNQYTIPVINNPDAVVEYEDVEYVNYDMIPVRVILNDSYSLVFISNGKETERTEVLSRGEYDYLVPIAEGNNEVLTYVVDSDGNMRSTAYTVIRDSIKPVLTLDMDYEGYSTYDDTMTITGTIKDYEYFMINETEPVAAGDGSFKSEYILRDGENKLNMIAVDLAGNETIYVATVYKLVKEPIKWQTIVFPIGAVILIVAAVIISKKRKKEQPADDEEKKTKESKEKKEFKFSFKNLKDWQIEIIKGVVVFIVCLILIKTVFIIGRIPSPSMEPTLKVGDYDICNGLAYVKNEPQRGDIVIFKMNGEIYIKRIIGLPGDTLSFADGYVYINDQLVYEEYLDEDIETNCLYSFGPVPANSYFVMGDNRENSSDSRYWNNPYISKSQIKGKLIVNIPMQSLKQTVKNIFAGAKYKLQSIGNKTVEE